MTINEKIQKIVDDLFNGNKAAFSKKIGVKPTTISNIIGKNRASKPSSDILESIVANIPELNVYWLMSGKGEMLKSIQNAGNVTHGIIHDIHDSNIGGNYNSIVHNETENKRLKKLLEDKDKQLEDKDEQIKKLLGIIEKLTNKIN